MKIFDKEIKFGPVKGMAGIPCSIELPITVREATSPDHYSKYYSIPTYCSNCGKHNTCYVLKGKLKSGLSIKCENCDCVIKL